MLTIAKPFCVYDAVGLQPNWRVTLADLLGELVGWILRAIAYLVFELFCFGTAVVVLPILSAGRLEVGINTPQSAKLFWRMPNGKVGVHPDLAACLGLIFWLVLAVGSSEVFRLIRPHL